MFCTNKVNVISDGDSFCFSRDISSSSCFSHIIASFSACAINLLSDVIFGGTHVVHLNICLPFLSLPIKALNLKDTIFPFLRFG